MDDKKDDSTVFNESELTRDIWFVYHAMKAAGIYDKVSNSLSPDDIKNHDIYFTDEVIESLELIDGGMKKTRLEIKKIITSSLLFAELYIDEADDFKDEEADYANIFDELPPLVEAENYNIE